VRISSTTLLDGILIVGLATWCGSPVTSQIYALGVANGTTLTVTLVVNGRAVRTFAPGSGTGAEGPS
jgi:hypothetical protein